MRPDMRAHDQLCAQAACVRTIVAQLVLRLCYFRRPVVVGITGELILKSFFILKSVCKRKHHGICTTRNISVDVTASTWTTTVTGVAVCSVNATQKRGDRRRSIVSGRGSREGTCVCAMNYALKRLTLMTLDRVTINTRATNRRLRRRELAC